MLPLPRPASPLRLTLLTLLTCCAAFPIWAQPDPTPAPTTLSPTGRPKRVYLATRLPDHSAVPTIDGQLDDACWQQLGSWSGDYTQLSPHHEAAPSQPTELKILYDDRNVYVAIRATDVPIAQRARLAGDRDGFVGDIVGVNFDSYHDLRTGFEFNLTSAGQKIDLRLANDGWDTTWNAVWEGKVHHAADHWSAEFLIPLSQLRFDPANEVWGLHAWRWIDRAGEESNWNLLANDDSGFVKSFGELQGLTGLRSARRLEITPYASARAEVNRTRPDRTDFNAGLDLKYGLTANITLDASVLPDFGQIEADPAVMNLTAFETFLTEKRPLFLEGKNIFDFDFGGDTLFYSRRIGQAPSYYPDHLTGHYPETTTLLGALKVTGKTSNGFSFGALASLTDSESARVLDPTDPSAAPTAVEVAPSAAQLVLRAQQDFRGGDTVVGGLLTHVRRDLKTDALAARLPEDATVLGADLTHYWADREYRLQFSAVGSDVNGDPRAISDLQLNSARYFQRPIDGVAPYDPTRDSLTGTGATLEFGKASKGRWRWEEEFSFKSRGLEFNDLGFLSEADRLAQETSIDYIVKDPTSWYNHYNLGLKQENTWTTRQEHLGSELELSGEIGFTNKWSTGGEVEFNATGYDPTALRGGPLLRLSRHTRWEAWLNSDDAKRISANAYIGGIDAADQSFRYAWAGVSVRARPLPNLTLRLSADLDNQTDRQRYQPVTALTGGDALFVSRLQGESRSLSLRVEWNLRPELSLQYYGNPFGLTLRHTEVRQVLDPSAAHIDDRLGAILPTTWTGDAYTLDPNADGIADYRFGEPDFNAASYRSNLVLKWEYRRGSMLYLVWAQQRQGADDAKSLRPWDVLTDLVDQPDDNQFMVKFTYWFSS